MSHIRDRVRYNNYVLELELIKEERCDSPRSATRILKMIERLSIKLERLISKVEAEVSQIKERNGLPDNFRIYFLEIAGEFRKEISKYKFEVEKQV